MNHSDYVKLIRRLGKISKDADEIRMCFSMYFAVTAKGEIVATSTPEQYKDPVKLDRAKLWMEVVKTDKELCQSLDGLTDGWFERNQERADKCLGPTADERELYDAMISFLSATATPVERWGVLYENTRNICNAWTAHALSWYPVLVDGQPSPTVQEEEDNPVSQEPPTVQEEMAPTVKTGQKMTVKVDRERLAVYFNDNFKTSQDGGPTRFDRLCNALDLSSYNRTELGRIAYAIKSEHKNLAKSIDDGIYSFSFPEWIREFFDILGLNPPKEKKKTKYNGLTGVESFVTTLLK